MSKDSVLEVLELDDEMKLAANAAIEELSWSSTIATDAEFDANQDKWSVRFMNRITSEPFWISLIHDETREHGLKETIKQKLLELRR